MQHHAPAILVVSIVLATVISAIGKRRGGHVVPRPCKKIFEEYEQLDCSLILAIWIILLFLIFWDSIKLIDWST